MPSFFNSLVPNIRNLFVSDKNHLEKDPSHPEVVSETNISRLLWNKFGKMGQVWEHEEVEIRGETIRIVSYNVLAQYLVEVHSHLYDHLRKSPEALMWDHRKVLLAEEIIRLNADILCLQEVQESHIDSFYRPLLEGSGYYYFFTKKREHFKDGCLIAARRTKFTVVDYRTMVLSAGVGSGLHTPHVGQFIRLESTESGRQIVVANTHLLFSPSRGDSKIGQISLIMSQLFQEGLDNGRVPFILCGDFNAACNSAVTDFITESRIQFEGYKQSELSGQKVQKTLKKEAKTATDETALPIASGIGRNSIRDILKESPVVVDANTLEHPFFVRSAFTPKEGSVNSPRQISSHHSTSWKPDNIFYSNGFTLKFGGKSFSSTLELKRRTSLPSLKLLKKTTGPWPTKHMPSDHIPLVAEFQLY